MQWGRPWGSQWGAEVDPPDEESGGGSIKKIWAARGVDPVLVSAILAAAGEMSGLMAKPSAEIKPDID